MSELRIPLIDELPNKLDLADRYGNVALQLAEVLQLPLPEIARVYSLPIPEPHGDSEA
jgi:hypothetical protein